MSENEVERDPEVQIQTMRLEKEAEALALLVEKLISRLNPLARPLVAKERADEPVPDALYARRLQTIRQQFASSRENLEDFWSVLEF